MTIHKMAFDASRLHRIRPEIEALLALDVVDSAYLAGSFSAGLETPTSDVDLYIMLNDDAGQELHMRQILTAGERIDVETYPLSNAALMVETTLNWTATPEDLSGLRQDENDVDFVVRLLHATVLKESPALSALQQKVESGTTGLRQLLIARWSLEANASYEDFRGLVSQAEYPSAAIIGGQMCTAAGKALAAGADDLYFGRKWIAKQINRSASTTFPHRDFQRALLGAWALDDHPSTYVDHLVRLVQAMLLMAQTTGWDSPDARTARFDGIDDQLHRDPSYLPLRLPSGILLNHERVRQLVVPPAVARVWGESDAAYAAADEHPISPERRTKITAALRAQGLYREVESTQPRG